MNVEMFAGSTPRGMEHAYNVPTPRHTPRLLIVTNVGWFFLSHRMPIGLAARASGYEVHVAAALDDALDTTTERSLIEAGLLFHRMSFSRSGTHPFRLLREIVSLYKLYKTIKPDVIHLVTLKPILLGGLAAKFAGMRAVVLAIPGRGSVFSAQGILATARRRLAVLVYRLAYSSNRTRVIVQNVEDRDYFVNRRIFSINDIRLIRGSGVDLLKFAPKPESKDMPIVVFASRMLKEKGVADFVCAATMLKSRGIQARFVLVGEPDHGNPHSHTRAELESWVATGAVEWWGFRSEMNAVFALAHIVCFPTYYGEGVPKVLIEAAACARPIVTSDMPGCRDIVRQGVNGFLIKPRDVGGIANAIERLLGDAELRATMGVRGRALVEHEFSLDIVVRQTLDVYRELSPPSLKY